MRIAISSHVMSFLSGQPLYNYELALQLKRMGHEVTVLSEWIEPNYGDGGEILAKNLDEAGVIRKRLDERGDFDLIIASERESVQVLDNHPDIQAINIIHSEYDYETPIEDRPQIVKYVCIRHSIMRHIINEHGIHPSKCCVIFNGIDRNRFKKKKKSKRDYYKIVVPCTLDLLREKFLNKLIDEATDKRRVFIYGHDRGATLHESKWATICPSKFNIEDEIADADEVAGILLGRVNLEAWSCGVNSSIYDPDDLSNKLYPPPPDFDSKHNIENVAKQILSVAVDLDDISYIVSNENGLEVLRENLECLYNLKNIFAIKGDNYAKNIKIGVKAVDTPYIILAHDDIRMDRFNVIRNMIKGLDTYEIVGLKNDSKVKGYKIEDEKVVCITNEGEAVEYPLGSFLAMKKETFEKLGGFNEKLTDYQDLDFYFRAEELGMKILIYDGHVLNHREKEKEIPNLDLFNKEHKWTKN